MIVKGKRKEASSQTPATTPDMSSRLSPTKKKKERKKKKPEELELD